MAIATETILRVSRRHPYPTCGTTQRFGVTSAFVIAGPCPVGLLSPGGIVSG